LSYSHILPITKKGGLQANFTTLYFVTEFYALRERDRLTHGVVHFQCPQPHSFSCLSSLFQAPRRSIVFPSNNSRKAPPPLRYDDSSNSHLLYALRVGITPPMIDARWSSPNHHARANVPLLNGSSRTFPSARSRKTSESWRASEKTALVAGRYQGPYYPPDSSTCRYLSVRVQAAASCRKHNQEAEYRHMLVFAYP
jgi:hypothetical protein